MLVEAMAAGNALLYLDTVEGRETVADAGLPFALEVDDLAAKMTGLLDDDALRQQLQQKGLARVAQHYSWETVTGQYEALLQELLGGGGKR